MPKLPNCPECNSEYAYEDRGLLICPECGHEWSAVAEEATEEKSVQRCKWQRTNRWRFCHSHQRS